LINIFIIPYVPKTERLLFMRKCIGSLFLIFYSSLIYSGSNSKPTIAINDLVAQGVDTNFSIILSERLRREVFETGKYRIIERSQMESILKEQGFQLSGCASDECAVQIGQLLGVKYIVSGTIGKLEDTYTIGVRIISVETGEVVQSTGADCQCKGNELLTKTIPGIAKKLTTTTTTTAQNGSTKNDVSIIKTESKNPEKPGNAVFVELFGKIPWYTLNYEFRLNNNFAVDIGAGASDIYGIAASLDYLLGRKNHWFEASIGLGYVYWPGNYGDFGSKIITPTIGYRFQKKKGFLFRCYAGPLFEFSEGFGILGTVGLSFGYSF
jgi:TolB-like protein